LLIWTALNPDIVFRTDFTVTSLPPNRPRMARYILARISNFIFSTSSISGGEMVTNPNAKSVTLEHVLPQNFGLPWKSAFSKDVDPSEFVYRIGNLTLLQKKINSEAANKSFKEKRRIALDRSVLPINKMFSTFTTWGDVEIENRQADLAKIALEIWKLA
jgi:hypothetical protein